MPFYDDFTDSELFQYVIWAEARGEMQQGMRAVGHVIKNRVDAHDFPKTLRGVLTQVNAFSCLLPNDPEFGKRPLAGDVQYEFCKEIVPRILAGVDVDITQGAHYYMNSATATSHWFLHVIVDDKINHPLFATIGKQNFYK